jgi:hypothetical protein
MMTLLLLIVGTAWGETTVQPRAHAQKIFPEIQANSKQSKITCTLKGDDECTIEWTPKAGATIQFEDKKVEADRMKGLALKWRDKTITDEEKDELLRHLVIKIFGL